MRNKPLKGIYNKPLKGDIVKKVGGVLEKVGFGKLANITGKGANIFSKGILKAGGIVKSGLTKGFKSYIGTKGINVTSLPSNLHLHRHAGQEQNKPHQEKGGKFFKKIKGKIKDATQAIGDRIDEVKEDVSSSRLYKKWWKKNEPIVQAYADKGIEPGTLYRENMDFETDTIVGDRSLITSNIRHRPVRNLGPSGNTFQNVKKADLSNLLDKEQDLIKEMKEKKKGPVTHTLSSEVEKKYEDIGIKRMSLNQAEMTPQDTLISDVKKVQGLTIHNMLVSNTMRAANKLKGGGSNYSGPYLPPPTRGWAFTGGASGTLRKFNKKELVHMLPNKRKTKK